eukprot:6742775-Prymnesium_polylepis.1
MVPVSKQISSYFRLFDPAPLHPSLPLPAPAPQKTSEVMALTLAGNGVRCASGGSPRLLLT